MVGVVFGSTLVGEGTGIGVAVAVTAGGAAGVGIGAAFAPETVAVAGTGLIVGGCGSGATGFAVGAWGAGVASGLGFFDFQKRSGQGMEIKTCARISRQLEEFGQGARTSRPPGRQGEPS